MEAKTIASLCPDLPDGVAEKHLARLPADYLKKFTPEAIAAHLRALSGLSKDRPAEVMVEPLEEGQIACTVIAFDHPFEFSLIAGTLAGAGFNIDSGDVYTLPAAPRPTQRYDPRHPRRKSSPRRDPYTAAVIIDRFVGRRGEGESFEDWSDSLVDALAEVIGLLDKRDEESIEQAKRRVNEHVTRRLAAMPAAPQPMLFPVELDLRRVDHNRIRLTITAQDTPAYLYSLTTALSLHGLSIDRVRIQPDPATQRFTDAIDLVPRQAGDTVDEKLLERIKLSALLTKQFTYFLERSPDPYRALTRFERLTEDIFKASESDAQRWVALLADPNAMGDLAKLLGTSDFLWEDFIRGQYESLQPILSPQAKGRAFAEPPETLPLRFERSLDGAVGLAQQQDRVNRFKDRELFLVDLDHILNPAMDFRQFSVRLTMLAENLVTVATRLVYDDLVRSYGAPRPTRFSESESRVPYAVFGLGKLGGVALGYASDIELLFVHPGKPTDKTGGGKRKPITTGEFYRQLVHEASNFIRTKRDGIFHVDLRLRPYGKEGPLAASADQFAAYYGPDGEAHPFEKLALVRLRWIAGDPGLGYQIEKLRNQFVYDRVFSRQDLEALWETWTRAKTEKLASNTRLNAKYSPGALVDLEGTVQLLQVTHASKAPQLRVPRSSLAMEALHRAGVLNAAAFADLRGAYDFLRRLINALRMLRGNALDLFLPPAESPELTHLARRMSYGNDAPHLALMRDFDQHTAAVRGFIESHFGRKCPGA